MRVRLECPAAAHRDAFIAAVGRSRALHGEYVNPPDTPHAYRRFVRQSRLRGEARFLSLTLDTGEITGVVTLGGIVQAPVRTASVGYYAFEPFSRRGFMREAVSLAIDHAFGALALERLDASIRPDNARSRALAERLGFRSDGLAPHEIRIGGRWHAHERWALYADEWRAARPAAARRLGARRAGDAAQATVESEGRRQTQ